MMFVEGQFVYAKTPLKYILLVSYLTFALFAVYFLGLTTLRRYFQNFQVAEGYLWSVDQLIRIKAQELTELQRIVTIQIDEVYLKSDINYVRVHHMFSRILNFLFVIFFFEKKLSFGILKSI